MVELHRVVARVIELINQEPRYFRELVRTIAEEHHLSFNESAELVGDALFILIEEGKVEKSELVTGPLTTSTVWTPYSIYIPVREPPIGWKKYNKLIYRKMERLKKLSEIGLRNAELYEKLVYEVVKKFYPDAIRTPFTSPLPDIYVPSANLIVEATTRYEYPITRNYLLWKYYHIAVQKDGEWVYVNDPYLKENPPKMLVIAPIVGKSAWELVKNQTKDPSFPHAYETGKKLIKVIQFPKKPGYPLFRKYRYYEKWLKEYHRAVNLIGYNDARKRLKKAIENALRNWELQEEVRVSSKTYND